MTMLATTEPRTNGATTIGRGMAPDHVELIKQTICKGATDNELAMFLAVCNKTGLDPFTKQIYAVKRWDKKANREVMAIQTGIDGYRAVAERTGAYAGSDEPVYDTESAPHPTKATVTVWKIVGNLRVSFTASARWAEYVQTDRDGAPTKFWRSMPYLMLAKVAEALALRKAFPNDLSGIYTADEMAQADNAEPREIKTVPLLERVKATEAVVVQDDAEAENSLVSVLVATQGWNTEHSKTAYDLAVLLASRKTDAAAAKVFVDGKVNSPAFVAAYEADPRDAYSKFISKLRRGEYDDAMPKTAA
jgi:phage recombination protein Bet